MPSSKNIVELRHLLSERFPNLRIASETPTDSQSQVWPTGLTQIDQLAGGGLPRGGITEVVSSSPACGSGLLLRALLRQAHQMHQILALIDGLDGFDPATVAPEILSGLLWVRCRTAAEAVKSADLALRDRNLPLVLLDLQLNPSFQLRKLGSSCWYRLQRIVEQTSSVFIVLTPSPQVGSAALRLSLTSRFDLADLHRHDPLLAARLSAAIVHGHRLEPSRIPQAASA